MFKAQSNESNAGFYLFLVYLISYLLNLPYRFKLLGSLHFDMIVVIILLIVAFLSFPGKRSRSENAFPYPPTTLLLILLVFYMVLTIPMAAWPGTVIKKGLPDFLKVCCFFLFAIIFINSQRKLEQFIIVYLVCIWIICFEPFFLYLTTGYMGYVDYSMGGTPFRRMTGLTNKIGGNPNALAMLSINAGIIGYYFLQYYRSKISKIFLIASFPMLFAVLILTGSRSGFLTAAITMIIIIISGKRKIIGVIFAVLMALIIWTQMGEMSKVRYSSMVNKDVAGRGSAENRIEHIKKAFKLFSQKPIFGYGIGTFAEVNFNYTGEALVSHNLYTGVLVEMGTLGFIIFFAFIYGIFKNFTLIKEKCAKLMNKSHYLFIFSNMVLALLISQLVFSVWAGNSTYYVWYLDGGLSVAALGILANSINQPAPDHAFQK